MKLSKLAAEAGYEWKEADVEITGLSYDSRKVKAGDLFFCISGFVTDGHQFAARAAQSGAAALVVTRKLPLAVPQLLVKNDREAMSLISAAFYGHPSRQMKMIGLTGTNGKTTSTYMIKTIAESAGYRVGLIGTIVNLIGDKRIETERTTPESPDLQALLRRMADEGCDMVVMEVSSHSLDLKRVEGIQFDVGVFTNLTQDHLDYHKTMEEYRKAKKRLFEQSDCAVMNVDDSAWEFLVQGIDARVATYGIEHSCDVRAKEIQLSSKEVEFEVVTKFGKSHMIVNIPGRFSVYNALASTTACLAMGITLEEIQKGLQQVSSVPGRFEVLPSPGRDFTVVLDYAHTPDSLKNILSTARGFAKGRIVTVFGCGGDRDRTKRPVMGKIAGEMSDFSIITSDNPRTEDPNQIINQIESGMKTTQGDYICIENRREAIHYALSHAQKDDFIILAGKGHETYQEINHKKHHFDEKEIVGEILKEI